jgi:galactokinase
VPFTPADYRLVIADTRKVRKLSDSKYNERVAECQAGLNAIRKEIDIQSLGELNIEALEDAEKLIVDPIILKRVRHVVTENRRVLDAVNALMNSQFDIFGELMNRSHTSLREDYEVTGIELDTMVELAQQQKGVLGSRMTGAGFGGCTVSLVKESCVKNFIKNVGKEYAFKTGLKAEFYLPEIVNGARRVPSAEFRVPNSDL